MSGYDVLEWTSFAIMLGSVLAIAACWFVPARKPSAEAPPESEPDIEVATWEEFGALWQDEGVVD